MAMPGKPNHHVPPVNVESLFRRKLDELRNPATERKEMPRQGALGLKKYTPEVRMSGPAALQSRRVDPLTSEDLESLALKDGVTRLYNRNTLSRKLNSEMKRCRRYKHYVTLVMLAIDDDLTVLSSDVVAALYKMVGEVVGDSIRDIDMAGYYKDNCFAVILPETKEKFAIKVAERIKNRVASKHINVNWKTISITMSAGIASFPDSAKDTDDLIENALNTLERARMRGGNTIAITDKM